jgi:hypothetical protein
MAEYSKVEILRSLYEDNALPQDKMALIKSLADEGKLEDALQALSQNQKFVNSLSAPSRMSELSGKVPLERKEPEYYRQRAEQFRGEAPRVETVPQYLSKAARPYLEAGGATTGAIVGAGSGLLTGPGAVAASPAGAVVGGGLGYAIGAEVADLLEQWAGSKEAKPLIADLTEAGKNIAIGSAMEMTGQAIGPALSAAGRAAMKAPAIEYGVMATKEALGKAPAMTQRGVEKLAGKFLHANTSKGPLIAKNIETAQAIEEQIPGLKFTYGEMTGDPGIVKLERSTMREPGQFAQDFIERQKSNDEAIQNFIQSQRPEGEIGNVIEAFQGQEAKLAAGERTAKTALEKETEALGMGAGQLEAGQTIRGEAAAGKEAAKKTGKELYGQVPEFQIDASSLIDDIDALAQPMNKLEDIEANVPWKQINKLREVLSETDNIVTPRDLDGFQSELKADIRRLKSPQATGGEVNERKLSRLVQLNQKIDQLLQKASTAETPAAGQLKKARTFWRQEIIGKFKKGDIGEILANKGGGEYKVSDAQIASKFFKPGPAGQQSARQFKNAIGGSTKAMQAIEDAAKQDLLSKFPGEEITESGLRRWLNRNKAALEEYGLTDRFDSVKKAREQLSDAVTFRKDFEKSEAAKLIGSDPDIAIKKALGAVNVGKSAANLMAATKGNKLAQAGLRNSLEDFILDQSRNLETGMITKIDTMDKLAKKYRPAMNVFYHENKTAMNAWDTARQAFRIAQKSRKSPMGAGSDTAENMLTSLYKALGVSSGRIGTLVRAFLKPLKDTEATKVKALVNRALLDPDFAYTLMLSADTVKPGIIKGALPKYHISNRNQVIKTGELPVYLQRRISQHLATITGTAIAKEEP